MGISQHFLSVHSVLKYANRFSPVSGFDEAVSLAIQNRIKAEIIGQWLYCFTTPLIGFQLQAIGFWYSFKHCAFVYSGNLKEGIADDETLDEIRSRLGSQKLEGGNYVWS
jgi:hypothetical protein